MAFTPQNFKNQVGPPVSDSWLNNVDAMVNNILGGVPTLLAVQLALGIANSVNPLPITLGGTGAADATTALVNLGGTTLAAATAAINPNPVATAAEALMIAASGGVLSIAAPQYDVGHVLRYGILPNLASAAAANTAKMNALVSYALNPVGWTGQLMFDNITGGDLYWFNDFVALREGISIDLRWVTWNFSKPAVTGNENNSGAIMAIRDCVIENGTINFNFPTSVGTGCTAIFLGARGAEGNHYNPFYDATYFANTGRTMGNITCRNLFITSNAPGQRCISALGGLRNVHIDNVWVDGQGVADGFYAEYGYATDGGGVQANRLSSHGNITFTNFVATNLVGTGSGGISYNGGYLITVNGLRVINAPSIFSAGFGEAYFFQPWSPSQDDGTMTRCTVDIRNVIAEGITGSGITLQGSNTSAVATGYLAAKINALATPAKWLAQTDLVGGTLENFVINGTSAGIGVQLVGTDRFKATKGRIIGFGKGINTTSESTKVILDSIDILDSTNTGAAFGQVFSVFSPSRSAAIAMTNCFIAGSANNAIELNLIYQGLIRGNTFGYSVTQNGQAEATQDAAVNCSASVTGLVCDGNNVQAVTSGNAYIMGSTASGGNTIVNATGITTASGSWENLLNSTSPDRGDVSFNYVPHADFTTQLFDSPLTANRVMTLTTATAKPGDTCTTLRSANATGASTLTVGTKVLAAGQWVTHKINRALNGWDEQMFGSL